MHRLVPEKLITIITSEVLEDRLVALVRNRGASGYTLQRARGAGAEGRQSGMMWIDTNLLLKVIFPPNRVTGMLDDLADLINKGHHLTVYVCDITVLDHEKFERPLAG